MKKLVINLRKVNKLGEDIEKNIVDFEKDRLLFMNEIKQFDTCWAGFDQNIFQNNTLEYLDKLKYDVDYLYQWSKYFRSSSSMFGSVEEDGIKKLRSSFDVMNK